METVVETRMWKGWMKQEYRISVTRFGYWEVKYESCLARDSFGCRKEQDSGGGGVKVLKRKNLKRRGTRKKNELFEI